ncbi:50S ribosomal protein L1 [Aminivibrio sp.]|jgi:large subunit ribosomal protein L1|uniref:50S ribosomal protein L1 n=1 Tax=Aminivibrio sp. TaxID=1872489 RepID=UPI0016B7BA23|nr:50S ribosomal protein L1 [Synergistaceae bacterium]NCC56589.1 50S ribosomal protein L1 [Synergistales bacterium]MDD3391317.1 50S ribosomal protein L1 [Synergistaceae bacterium]MDD4022027.1 50S ribosomal protein L1 [Synergistaceae bacterium]MDD4613252.1 50S ribosomal protein L1 [Synergistaceae bacterium]
MAKVSKRMKAAVEKIEKGKLYGLKDAISLFKETATAKFDESIEVHIRLGVDPRHADQQVRSTVVLPHGTGITKRVLVLAMGEKVKEAEEAGADFVGGDDIVAKISGGWLDFDAVIATPDMMKSVGRLGKLLGPRGLMPSAKTGTVTFDLADAIREIKAGRVEFRVDKFGIVHNGVGKKSFAPEQLYDNVKTLFQAVLRARPASVKGTYVKSFSLASTMGPGIKIDPSAAQKEISAE